MTAIKQPILDPTCGSRMFYFDKTDDRVLFGDQRNEAHLLCDGRELNIAPDIELDFRDLPFEDAAFSLVIFDPPHLVRAGKKSWLALKYGVLGQDWQHDMQQGFQEVWRVLKPNGTLIFKWNETQIKMTELTSLFPSNPVCGHRTTQNLKTHWLVFFKEAEQSPKAVL